MCLDYRGAQQWLSLQGGGGGGDDEEDRYPFPLVLKAKSRPGSQAGSVHGSSGHTTPSANEPSAELSNDDLTKADERLNHIKNGDEPNGTS
jgi:glycogen(starch) synthase